MAWPEFIFLFVSPDSGILPESECQLFTSLMRKKHWAEAVKFYEEVLQRVPDYPPALNALALVAYENRDYGTAFKLLGNLLKRFPENPFWLNNFALVAAARHEPDVARVALQEALRIAPEQSVLNYNSGCLLVCEGELEAALQVHRQIVVDDPKHIRALFAISRIAKELGFVDEAIKHCRRLVELAPGNAEFQQNLGFMLLKNGEWDEGLDLYEARWQANHLDKLSPERLWQGQDVSGKIVLIWAEQGLGDSINFAAYLPLLLKMSGVVVVAVQSVLVGLFSSSFPGIKVVSLGEVEKVTYDFHLPLLSLPRLFKTRPATLPVTVPPYLKVDDGHRKKWQAGLKVSGESKMRVGVVWRSNPVNIKESRRSLPLKVFSRTFANKRVMFYCLQKELATEDSELLVNLFVGNSKNFTDLSSGLGDFQDTAAILQSLDLLISCDTSVPHLAGALACPVWLLLPFDADWRWLLEREDSLWYPTMRLFRQPEPGAWGPVIEKVCCCLQDLVDSRLS
jgi:tetratricopeptide (TPR) repeat protein